MKSDRGRLARAKKLGSQNDFYPTPDWCTDILFNYWQPRGLIWECACGDGRMVRNFLRRGLSVIHSDKYPQEQFPTTEIDFLEVEPAPIPYFTIVTNPPFSIINRFMEKAMTMNARAIAFWARQSLLESKWRYSFFKMYPPRMVIVIADRAQINSEEPGGQFSFAWYVWETGYRGPTELFWDAHPSTKQEPFVSLLAPEGQLTISRMEDTSESG